ncbi:uncharacterized protein BDR25DRAFT_300297 [Lindgomyces ingoldianus]|uniref:Uncharacterized protein n=1 Tax=Lindgomyces ingoldianus TaxID=673940 RepID=A0ACB6RGA3_9PLEO|nr:uncharacterized protein BDR25DRAFT_300297 [Lindgomyces ingoldianus]KAF2477337.1 hypothetical protein BDR25DRAFT_300297 [Lindgomyces ingoldianus]
MVPLPLVALLSVTALILPTNAAPTRTHCRCFVVDANKPWSPSAILHDTSRQLDTCAHMGPEIEYFRISEPEIYQTYYQHIVHEQSTATPTEDDLRPLTTTVLMELARKDLFEHQLHLDTPLPSAPTERPRERIICRSEPEPISEYHDSELTLFALGVIVVLAILACVAECINLLMGWAEQRELLRRSPVRLAGDEKKLRAYSSSERSPEWRCPSPETRVYTAYLIDTADEDDDEINRPVM